MGCGHSLLNPFCPKQKNFVLHLITKAKRRRYNMKDKKMYDRLTAAMRFRSLRSLQPNCLQQLSFIRKTLGVMPGLSWFVPRRQWLGIGEYNCKTPLSICCFIQGKIL